MTDNTTKLTLADLDAVDAAVKALEDPGHNLGYLDADLFPRWSLGWPEYIALAANHAPTMTAAIRELLKVAIGARRIANDHNLTTFASGSPYDEMLRSIRAFEAGPFAGLLETVSGEGGDDAE